ncbi:uncharacterized protein LY89DRAFT_788279 [Mollisia scopiformis]|uniref:2EXR domain-containing protein n=1 Tax=Mollisia scopiformis TaxID=149040 RepID=A0A132BAL3_MOLSC|nr:uncharacterized protein LY89DRAFT_788279 [Mollisia scopiformis]KUJ09418.1 hypothetical protein LY89DRAFT_788279 [Mollisia scopiformis]
MEEFEFFPELPKELRLLIWETALGLEEPRIVSIQQKCLKKTIGAWEKENNAIWPPLDRRTHPRQAGRAERTGYASKAQLEEQGRRARGWISKLSGRSYKKASLMGVACNTPPPSLLLVSHEARDVALKRYSLILACPQSNPETYFDFTLDTLYMTWRNFNRYRLKPTSPAPQLDVWNGFIDFDNLFKVERLAIQVISSRKTHFDEKRVAEVLRVFPSVKQLSLVAQHYHDSNLSALEQSDLCLTDDPIDVEEAFNAYHNFEYNEDEFHSYYGFWTLPVIQESTLLPRKTRAELEELQKDCERTIGEIDERIAEAEEGMWDNEYDMYEPNSE